MNSVYCLESVQEFKIWKIEIRDKKICNIASGKRDDSRLTLHMFDIGFVVLSDGHSCCISVAQCPAQQNPTHPLGGQNTHTHTNFSNIVNLLLETTDGRGGMLN